MPSIVLALGSNQGDRQNALNRACEALSRSGIRILLRSRLYHTRPLRLPGQSSQPWYLNAAVLGMTQLRPLEALARCLEIERSMGRIRRERWEARRIDIDIIFYDSMLIEHPMLHVPHPAWNVRDFVLAPLLDLGFTPPGIPAHHARPMLKEMRQRSPQTIETTRVWD